MLERGLLFHCIAKGGLQTCYLVWLMPIQVDGILNFVIGYF